VPDAIDPGAFGPLPALERRYTTVALYVVGAGIALAPILGTQHVPGFSPIAAIFPQNLQRGVVPFASFLLTIPMLAGHFFASDDISAARLNRIFSRVLPLVIALALILYYFYSAFVVQVEFEGGNSSAAYVVGEHMVADCPCAARSEDKLLGVRARPPLDIAVCVGPILSANPDAVTACYPRAETNSRRAILAITYLLLMTSFGAIIALVVKKESLRRHAQRRGARAIQNSLPVAP
jgi:hypothetical protein